MRLLWCVGVCVVGGHTMLRGSITRITAHNSLHTTTHNYEHTGPGAARGRALSEFGRSVRAGHQLRRQRPARRAREVFKRRERLAGCGGRLALPCLLLCGRHSLAVAVCGLRAAPAAAARERAQGAAAAGPNHPSSAAQSTRHHGNITTTTTHHPPPTHRHNTTYNTNIINITHQYYHQQQPPRCTTSSWRTTASTSSTTPGALKRSPTSASPRR